MNELFELLAYAIVGFGTGITVGKIMVSDMDYLSKLITLPVVIVLGFFIVHTLVG